MYYLHILLSCYYLDLQGRPDSDDRPSVPTPSPWGWLTLVSFGLRGEQITQRLFFFLLFKRLADALSEMTRSYVTDEQASSPAKQQMSETASLLETVSVPKRLRSTCFFWF